MSIIVPLEGFGGGGANLNFKVVAYATEAALLAAAPKENTIGIITDSKITWWEFNTIEPINPFEGLVWIKTGVSSPAMFNVLKKNGVMVYPQSAKQYVGGAWVNVTAMSYQGGNWKRWVTYLYNAGDTCDDLTGGWMASSNLNAEWAASQSGQIVLNDVTMVARVGYTSGQIGGLICTKKVVDVSEYNTLYFRSAYTEGFDVSAKIGLFSSTCARPETPVAINTISSNAAETLYSIDISNVKGSYYAGIWIGWANATGTASVTTREIYMA